MSSKWFELKLKAIELRKLGISMGKIEKSLGIPKSTLSSWFRGIKLNKKAQYKITEDRLKHLRLARSKAVKWHNEQKKLRLNDARAAALKTLIELDTINPAIKELALSMLYLGEGGKGDKSGTLLGSSDPLILKFFTGMLIQNYKIDVYKIKCALHLRADQNPEKLKRYWSQILNLPIQNFMKSSVDSRTKGRPTYPSYKGVCVVSCGNTALQRKLMFLSRGFCEKIAS